MKPRHHKIGRTVRDSNGAGGRRWHQASALLMLSLAAATASVEAACELKQIEIPVRISDRRPIATLTLNGTEMPMLLDSGAFFSMLSPAAATQLNLPLRNLPSGARIEGYTGRIEARQTMVEKVGLLGAELRNIEFLVGGNELGSGIMGLLGRNVLAAADTEYDLAHGVVRLSFPKGDCKKTNFAHWAGQSPVVVAPLEELHRADNAIRLHVSINGKQTLALLDTGAPQTALTMRTARRAGIEERDLTPAGRAGGAGKGRAKAWTGLVGMFELGGEKIANNRMQIDETDSTEHGVVVGLDYFLSHRIYVSRLQGQVYVTWNGGPVFAQGREAAGEYDAQYAALPPDVAKSDAGALARRGAAALAAGNYQRALEDLNRAHELAPGNAEHVYTRAQVHMALRDGRPALADLDEALRLDPAFAEARYRRAWVRTQLSDRAGAQADLAQLDEALPPSSNLRADMGRLYSGFSDGSAKALRQFDLWVNSHPADERLAGVLNQRCWLRTRMNIDPLLALKDCKAAVDKDDGEASYRDSLGWTYLRLGEFSKSKEAFDGAIKLEPLPFSLYGRALAQLRLNDKEGAERDLAAARKLKPQIDEDVHKEGFDFAEVAERLKVSGS